MSRKPIKPGKGGEMRRLLASVVALLLVGTPAVFAAGFVFVATPLDNDDLVLAEDLADDIPNCSAIAYWDEVSQGWVQHINNIPPNNFNVYVSMPYMATVTADGIWTLCGGVPDSTDYINLYNLAVGFSSIMLPLNMTYYSYAEEVVQSISQCNVIAYWDATSQGWVQHIQGIPPNNFTPRVGYPYMLTCQSAGTWPSSLPPARQIADEDTQVKSPGRSIRLNTAAAQTTDR
jgi:hypothetical protein